jgi:hypothetical protein
VANIGTSVSLFPTLLGLMKKGAAPYPHVIATSDIYNSYSPFISSKVGSSLHLITKKQLVPYYILHNRYYGFASKYAGKLMEFVSK